LTDPFHFWNMSPPGTPPGTSSNKENNKMQVQAVTVAQFADILEQADIIETTDHGPTITHRGNHPELGQIVMVSSAMEPWLIVRE
jgi:hypothetical protein